MSNTLCLLLSGLLLIWMSLRLNKLNNEIAVLKIAVFNLQKKLGINFISPELEKQLLDLISQGKKVEAIKILKQEKNMSLSDAKYFIDSLR